MFDVIKSCNQDACKSALRHFVLTAAAVYTATDGEIKAFLFALAAAVVGPGIRAIDKKDPAFGRVADAVEQLLKKEAAKRKKK